MTFMIETAIENYRKKLATNIQLKIALQPILSKVDNLVHGLFSMAACISNRMLVVHKGRFWMCSLDPESSKYLFTSIKTSVAFKYSPTIALKNLKKYTVKCCSPCQ